MDKSYVVVLGKGITSRANLEALVEDYFYSKGKDVYLVLAFDSIPSQGQIFAAQYAKDKNKEIVIYCNEGANLQAFPSASVTYSKSPVTDSIDLPDSTIMLLWDNSDPDCMVAAEHCESLSRRAFNLCEGLTLVTRETKSSAPKEEKEEKPVETPTVSNIKREILETVITALQDALKKA